MPGAIFCRESQLEAELAQVLDFIRTTMKDFGFNEYRVELSTRQIAMRHSDPKLTANVYTDPKLLDVAGAVESLPNFLATGTDPKPCAPLAQTVSAPRYPMASDVQDTRDNDPEKAVAKPPARLELATCALRKHRSTD